MYTPTGTVDLETQFVQNPAMQILEVGAFRLQKHIEDYYREGDLTAWTRNGKFLQ